VKNFKGIILAGGKGSRLYPLTKVTNKHLLPLGGEPMINHPVRSLVNSGINDIMIVTGIEHCGAMISLLGSGHDYNCTFTYKVQDRPDGIAGALRLCKEFVGESNCVVILGDNIFDENLEKSIRSFEESKSECMLFFKKVIDPRRYGVGTFKKGRLVNIEEKPEKPKSNLACIGIYMYSSSVFDIIDKVEISSRGEYEITELNNFFLRAKNCDHVVIDGRWTDAGTMDSYHLANSVIYNER
jgi:glucose-1-phosphate thymidylyltransferase